MVLGPRVPGSTPAKRRWRSSSVLLSYEMQEAHLPAKTLISIIDDDEDFREALQGLMTSMGFTVEAFSSALDFLERTNIRDTSCLITDVHMPQMTGIELHRRLIDSGYLIPTILITAYPDESVRIRAMADGIIGYLTKPCDADELLRCVSTALERAEGGEHH
jgi:FixJ family two-component response regulator